MQILFSGMLREIGVSQAKHVLTQNNYSTGCHIFLFLQENIGVTFFFFTAVMLHKQLQHLSYIQPPQHIYLHGELPAEIKKYNKCDLRFDKA